MKEIINKGRYSLAYELVANGIMRKFSFPCKRVFVDTGNVADTGVTKLSDDDYALLAKVKVFNQAVERGELVVSFDDADKKMQHLAGMTTQPEKAATQAKTGAKK